MTQKLATDATGDAKRAVAMANAAAKKADEAAQVAAPFVFGGTPLGQQLALPSPCRHGTSPCTSQPFPADATPFYVTDVLLSNPGGGEGALTLTLGPSTILEQTLQTLTSLDLKLSTPLLLSGDKRLALKVTCDEGPNCTPSVYVSGFAPVKPPDPSGPDGTPEEISLELKCPKNCSVRSPFQLTERRSR